MRVILKTKRSLVVITCIVFILFTTTFCYHWSTETVNNQLQDEQNGFRFSHQAPISVDFAKYLKPSDKPADYWKLADDEQLLAKRYFSFQKKVNVIDHGLMIKGDDICKEGPPYLLIIVPSVPYHFKIRNAIRSTYGSYVTSIGNKPLQNSVKIVFILGRRYDSATEKQLRNESKTYGDIVQADFTDSYYNLTRKMIVALKWTTLFCPGIEFLLKIDEDTFVKIPLLLALLNVVPRNEHGTIYGHMSYAGIAHRTGLWAVSTDEYPVKRYPPYATGNTYVILGRCIPEMSAMVEYIPYMPMEDVFVTGILARAVGANHFDLNGFARWKFAPPNPCEFIRGDMVSASNVTLPLMKELWQISQTLDTSCATEATNTKG